MSQPGGAFDFNPFFPGLDFFTGKGAFAWPMPTVSEQELDKRISELKTVLFWLEQNAAGVKAGIQALEVQKMTLATLQSMNVGAAELARAFAMPPVSAPAAAPASAPAPESGAPAAAAGAAPDPLQWWNALTRQFQDMAAATAAQAANAMTAPLATQPADSAHPAVADQADGASAAPDASAKPHQKTGAKKTSAAHAPRKGKAD